MKLLRIVSLAIAFLLAAGEIARWWGDPRFVPLAFDELLVASALAASALAANRKGHAPLAAAWGLYSGLMLSLLVPTLDHLLFGPPKESAAFYGITLAALLALGLWGMGRALCLCRTDRAGR